MAIPGSIPNVSKMPAGSRTISPSCSETAMSKTYGSPDIGRSTTTGVRAMKSNAAGRSAYSGRASEKRVTESSTATQSNSKPSHAVLRGTTVTRTRSPRIGPAMLEKRRFIGAPG